MSKLNEDKELRRKKLLYQSIHRGCKETDIIIGEYAKKNLYDLSDQQLDLYEEFIAEKDWDIYAWATGTDILPEKYNIDFIKKMLMI